MTKLVYNNLSQMDQSESKQNESEADIYKRIKILGTGSYGRAFLVQDKQTLDQWVIKQINLADMAPQEQQASLKQAKILQMLKHPNIVRFRQVYRTSKMKLNIVMQYAGGGDLSHRIKHAKEQKMHFSQKQIMNWFVQICLAVRYIHSNKIIHRDLKAQNVFLDQNGMVKLGDFGVAKVLEHTAAKARTVVGSPYYLSPQIIQNKPYSCKTDIWSLGALLYELCALQPPFKANNIQFLALKIVQGAPPPIPKQYSEGLKSLIRYMLQTKESNRPTINQIFSEKIVLDTIKRLEAVPQPIRQIPSPHTTTDFIKMSTLKPPPDLLNFDTVENKSDIVKSNRQRQEEEEDHKIKAQTPQINVRKGPNNFFHRPLSSRKKVESHPLSNPSSHDLDLAGLMQIKPSLIQKQEKHEKPQVPLPPMPKPSPSTRAFVAPKPPLENKQKVQLKEVITPPSTAFSKKRSSVTLCELEKKQPQKPLQVKSNRVGPKKTETTDLKKDKQKKKAPAIRKKTYTNAKKQTGGLQLQVCSQQAKKRQNAQKKPQKKKSQNSMKKQQKPKKEKKSEEHLNKRQEIPIMEQEKCNAQIEVISNNETDEFYSHYQDEEFQEYNWQSDDEVTDLAFSMTNENINPNFQQIRMELGQIQKIVEAGQDVEKNPYMGQSIPELINFSAQLRDDDTEFDSNHSTHLDNVQKSEAQNINLQCLRTLQDLQLLRIKLEDIFGVQDIIFAYKAIEEKVDSQGLNFSQEDVISDILQGNSSIDQVALRKYFGHIVTIISRQKILL